MRGESPSSGVKCPTSLRRNGARLTPRRVTGCAQKTNSAVVPSVTSCGRPMPTVNAVESLLQLSAGYYVSRALHAVAELGVADALSDAPQPTAALADRTAAHAGALDRVLRLLAQYGCSNITTVSSSTRRCHACCVRIIRNRCGRWCECLVCLGFGPLLVN